MILKEFPNIATQEAESRTRTDSRDALPQIGLWRAVGRLATGRLTEVFRAVPTAKASGIPAPYVLKVLRADYENIPGFVQRFCRAARIGRRVSHPSIIPVLDAQVTRPPFYMVLPWIEGASLRELYETPSPIPLPSLLWIVRQIAGALAALFDAGYMHGDVKPDNVIVSRDWHATLVDLEFARKVPPESDDLPAALMGTLPYLAPELVLSNGNPDIRCDIYGLGIVLYEGLVGTCPFPAETPQSLIESLRRHGVPNLRRVMPHLPRSLAELVRSMTAKEPLRRPQTPHDVVATLVDVEIETFSRRQWE